MRDFVLRNTPKIADTFIFETIEADNGKDCFKIYTQDKKIVIAGNNNVAKAMGYYRYLTDYCGCIITSSDYDISTIGQAPLPDKITEITISQKIRARTSYEFFAIEGNFWGFDRWEKEIDFMAMHGINAPLQLVGFDSVMYHFLDTIGLDKKLCLEFSSGPAFLPGQITGNIAATHSVNSTEYLERKLFVGKQIMQREKELDMMPILPGIIPSVPFSIRKKYIKMEIFKAPFWYNLPPVFYIKPENAFFDIFNDKFLKIQKEILGETDYYIFDPLYDVNKRGYNSYLENIGRKCLTVLKEFNPDSKCFVHQNSINSDFFNNVSSDDYIIITEPNEQSQDLKNSIISISGNKYGRTAISGNIIKALGSQTDNNSLGFALELDTFSINDIYCAAVLKGLYAENDCSPESFYREYSIKKYKTPNYTDEVRKLSELCYNSDVEYGSIICSRPSTVTLHTAIGDTLLKEYDYHKLYEIAQDFSESEEKKNEAVRTELINITRQFLSDIAYPVYKTATKAFNTQNIELFEQTSNLFLEICEDMDKLLKTKKENNLVYNYELAHCLGKTPEEREKIDINYLLLHTIWGPIDHSQLYDRYWVEWGGMVSDFYAKRWHMYYKALAVYFNKPRKLKDVSKKRPYERNEYKRTYQSKRLALFENEFLSDYMPNKKGMEEADTIETVKDILTKYSEIIKDI